jgi:ribonuclease HI
LSRRNKKRKLIIHTDGAIRDNPPVTGVGVVIRDGQGRVLDWISEATEGRLTCNEAEYAALIRALKAAEAYRPREVHLHLDSLIVVNQMRGRFAVRSPALQRLNAQARRLARRFRQVTFTHVRRKRNRLADALANEAVEEARTEARRES